MGPMFLIYNFILRIESPEDSKGTIVIFHAQDQSSILFYIRYTRGLCELALCSSNSIR